MAEIFVNCPACLDMKPDESRITKRPPLLFDVAQVRAFRTVPRTDVRHAFDLPRIWAQYSLRQRVNCSFPGHHSHMNGFIGAPRCSDFNVCVGHQCALYSILCWDELSERLGEFNVQRSRIAKVLGIPELSARFARLDKRVIAAPKELIMRSNVLMHTHEASVFQRQCRSSWDPETMSEANLEAAARVVQNLAESIVAAEHEMDAIEMEIHGAAQRQREIDTKKVVRREVQQLFRDMQRRQ